MSMLAQGTTVVEPRVADVMTRHPITIARETPVEVAASLLKSCRIRHLPVTDAGRLAGVISLRDVLPAPPGSHVSDILKQPVHTATPTELVTHACERMLQKRISSLPVLDGDRLAGIFTATDALQVAEQLLMAGTPPMRAEQIMTARPLVTIAPDAPLSRAWTAMRDQRVRHLPVLSSESLVGILSDHDVLAAGREWLSEAADGARHPALLVADAMSKRVFTIGADHEALEAAHLLLRRRVGALPVVRGREIVGMLAVSDFLYWILSRP